MKKFSLAIQILALLFLIVFLSIYNIRIFQERKTASLEAELLAGKIEALGQSQELAQAKLSASEQPSYLEKVAREELNLKKAGEKVVAFPVFDEEESATSFDSLKEPEKSWLKKLLGQFGF